MSVIKLRRKAFVTVGSSEADYITDGTADDVQIVAALATGKRVVLKDDTFNLAATIAIPSDAVMEGAGSGKTILRLGAGLNISCLTNADAASGITINVKLKGMTIDQQGATQTAGGGLAPIGIQGWTLEDLVFEKSYRFNFLATHQGNVADKTGTVTLTNGSDAVTGSGTTFTTDLAVGDIIKSAGSNFARVLSITSDTALILTRPWGYATETSVTYKQIEPNNGHRFINVKFRGTIDDADACGMGFFDDSVLINCDAEGAAGGGCGFVPDHTRGIVFINCNAGNDENSGFSFETCEDGMIIGGSAHDHPAGNGVQFISGSIRNKVIGTSSHRNVNGFASRYNSTSVPPADENEFIGVNGFWNTGYGWRSDGSQRNRVTGRFYNNDLGNIIVNTLNSRTPDNNIFNNAITYDNRDVKVSARGIYIAAGTGNEIIDCKADDADHVTAGVTDSGTNTVIINTNGTTNTLGRTRLGLVAGGAGDIWVEKAGDTMTGLLLISVSSGDGLQINGTGTNNSLLRFQDDGVNRGEIFFSNGSTNMNVRAAGSVLMGGGGTVTNGVSINSSQLLTAGSGLTVVGTTTLSTALTGLLKAASGVVSAAAAGTDYYAPGSTDVALADGGTGASLADPNADRIMFWDDSAGAVTWLVPNTGLAISGTNLNVSVADATTQGIVELATAAETTTGTDATRAVTPDGLAGSDYGKRVVSIQVTDPNGSALATGDGQAYFRVPAIFNGYNIVAVAAHVTTVSSSGAVTVQLHNVTDAVDILSTALTIDASEKDSATAATPAVINASNDDVATADELRVDIDGAGTGAKGLIVELTLQLP